MEDDLRDAHAEVIGTPDGKVAAHPEQDSIGDELLRHAFSDPLTGLLGGVAFDHLVENALARTESVARTAVVCLDLDGVQTITDRFGAAAGEQVVVHAARRLAEAVRAGDAATQSGANRYVVLLERTTEAAAIAVAARLLGAVGCPLQVQGHHLTLSASAGVALNQASDTVASVVQNAVTAMRRAKETDGGGPVVYGRSVFDPVQPSRTIRPRR